MRVYSSRQQAEISRLFVSKFFSGPILHGSPLFHLHLALPLAVIPTGVSLNVFGVRKLDSVDYIPCSVDCLMVGSVVSRYSF